MTLRVTMVAAGYLPGFALPREHLLAGPGISLSALSVPYAQLLPMNQYLDAHAKT